MKINSPFYLTFFVLLTFFSLTSAQVDSGIKQISPSGTVDNVFDLSGDGRFALIESKGNIATYNPRNADGNDEIFILDYAQRHIFQLTDTKNVLVNPSGSPTQNPNIKVLVYNTRPQISNDGRWIAFGSNAASSIAGNTNPGSFDGNAVGVASELSQDGNTEIWMYQIPTYQAVDLTSGTVPPFVDLAAGAFIRITDTPPSTLPFPGSNSSRPKIADDNRDASIDDDGSTIAFVSNRDLVAGGNQGYSNANDEIFTYKRFGQAGVLQQITITSRGTAVFPLYNLDPSISGNGQRVVFLSKATNPVQGMSGGCNPEFNTEIIFTDLNSQGAADGIMRQITFTPDPDGTGAGSPTLHSPSAVSRDGRYILLYSRSKLNVQNDDGVEAGTADFLYDSQVAPPSQCQENAAQFRQISPRSNADPAVPNDFNAYTFAQFTDYDSTTLAPNSIILKTRANIRADGTIAPTNAADGLNPLAARPSQIYSYAFTATSPIYKRLTNSPILNWNDLLAPVATNNVRRIGLTAVKRSSNLFDPPQRSEIFYLNTPKLIQETIDFQFDFKTGAGGLDLSDTVPAAQGLTPSMLGTVSFSAPSYPMESAFATNVSNARKFPAPLELAGAFVSIDGIAAYLMYASNGQINFIVPAEVTPGIKSFVVNSGGIVLRGTIPIVAAPRPDILTNLSATTPSAGGRARLLNVTDPNNPTPEPFSVTTQTANGTFPTRLRLFVTGVEGVTAGSVSIQIGSVTITSPDILTNATPTDYPGIYSFDFLLPQSLAAAGNVPIIISVTGSQTVQSRTINPPRLQINVNQLPPDDIAVWRPGSGTNASSWYILNAQQQTISYQFGYGTDTPVTRDFDGDGKVDFCVFRESAGQWHIVRSSDNSYYMVAFGAAGDKPAAADYDGDGKADIAVFRPSNGAWYIINSSTNTNSSQFYGTNGDEPEPADYDGDGKADVAVWRKTAGSFYAMRSSDSGQVGASIGADGDRPVIGDYDGDGKADFAIWRPATGVWHILNSSSSLITYFTWGATTDIPVPGNYSDGDSKTDIAVWRPSNGVWYIHKSTDGGTRAVQWGQSGDIPVPAPYRR